MKKIINFTLFFLAVVFSSYSQQQAGEARNSGGPIDLIVLVDTSSEMSGHYREFVEYVSGPFLREFLRIGDTFHILSFSDAPKTELARRIEGVGDVETIIGRLYLLYPLGGRRDLDRALDYAETYIAALPNRPGKFVLFTAGQEAVQFTRPGTDFYPVQFPLTGPLPSSGRPPRLAPSAPPAAQPPQSAAQTPPAQSQPPPSAQARTPPPAQAARTPAPAQAPPDALAQTQPPAQSQPPQSAAQPPPAQAPSAAQTPPAAQPRQPAAQTPAPAENKPKRGLLQLLADFFKGIQKQNTEKSPPQSASKDKPAKPKPPPAQPPSSAQARTPPPAQAPSSAQPPSSAQARTPPAAQPPSSAQPPPPAPPPPSAQAQTPSPAQARTPPAAQPPQAPSAAQTPSSAQARTPPAAQTPPPAAQAPSSAQAAQTPPPAQPPSSAQARTPPPAQTPPAQPPSSAQARTPPPAQTPPAQPPSSAQARTPPAAQAPSSTQAPSSAQARTPAPAPPSSAQARTPPAAPPSSALAQAPPAAQTPAAKPQAAGKGGKIPPGILLPVLISLPVAAVTAFLFFSIRRKLRVIPARAVSSVAGRIVASPPHRIVRVKPDKKPMIYLEVDDQNRSIGRRNTHSLKAGATYTVGGRNSDFLIFLVPLPSSLGILTFDGKECSFVPKKLRYFPELSGEPVPDCIEKTIRVVSASGYKISFRFRRYEDPLLAINRIMSFSSAPL